MSTERRTNFGRYLARLRGTRSQRQQATLLCELAGSPTLTRHEVSRWERGERIPDDWLPFIARAHNVPLAELERRAAHARSVADDTTPPFDLSALFGEADAFTARITTAWQNRTTRTGAGPSLILVGGYAGSGKTEFARFLADLSGWAVLDKDALTRRMTERLLTSLGGDPHDRHTDLYRAQVRPDEYRSLLNVAHTNIDCGVSVILAAPFITELTTAGWLERLTNRCHARGVDVSAIWIHSDTATMHDYIEQRAAPRDRWKLSHWDEYTATLNTDGPPPGVHHTIDNRHGSAISLTEQTRTTLSRLMN